MFRWTMTWNEEKSVVDESLVDWAWANKLAAKTDSASHRIADAEKFRFFAGDIMVAEK
jgi:hypothetical protein